MIEQFVNFVIRPPRSEYNPDQYLWETEFILAGRKYKRLDLEATYECKRPYNKMQPLCSCFHSREYFSSIGCRADANEAAVILLPANITVFTLDFSGSGLSGGDYVSLGWHEKEDLKCVVSYLRTTKQVSCIGLWGRSMGAVTSLLYGAEDSSIAGMVLDSAFTNLYGLMMELVDVYKIRVPKFTVKMAVQYMRKIIQKRAKFDIMDLNVLQFAPKTFIPAFFGHASNDMFIQPHHCDRIHQAYGGDKSIIKFEGDHNSPRPQSYYDSVSMFFYNTLHPPQLPVKCSNNLGAFKVGTVTNESFIFEIISGLRGAGTNSCSSSIDASKFPNATAPVVELLSESVNQLSIKNDNDLDFLLDENHTLSEIDGDSAGSRLQDKSSGHNEESCSCTSSNRESWGRCSSLGGASDDSFPGDISDKQENMTVKALATPLRQKESKSTTPKTKEKKSLWKKLNRERAGVGDSLSQRLKMCLSHSSRHKRVKSSGIV
uniref:Serine aminopeptidase S33 domain-containing protein n=1 Tax=Oryza meridionalis TaxID=40149 RepID=A0A0E0CHB8_9ORYZ